ncbi:hypothetical protein E6W39_30815 [Kitasatospora acidiphila]|uniref:Uncharacterized protein n=1 Tax=Kitasatospora acidiphila TaxID=2567942 RepID=A0A540WA24_9ACTN|nr:hypothetical protein [Kitasatospora acidiphila]TQF05822.1 hypothetical protein E6W39_30815 [Kitasatospora acidiphila]
MIHYTRPPGRSWQTPTTCGLLLLAAIWQTYHGILYLRTVTPLSHCHTIGKVSVMSWTSGYSALTLTLAAAVTAVLSPPSMPAAPVAPSPSPSCS